MTLTTAGKNPGPAPGKSYFSDAPIALVIGCGDLGVACARAIGQRTPIVMVDRDQARLDAAVAALEHDGYAATAHACDISDAAQVEQLGAMLARGNGIRVLAHVAAIGRASRDWRKVMDVNVRGLHLVVRAAGPHIVTGGVAVFMSSIGARLITVDSAVDDLLEDPFQPDFHARLAKAFGREPIADEGYSMSKRAMNMLATRLAVEWGPRQVRSLTISPGIVDTTMARNGGTGRKVQDADGTERDMSWAEMALETVPLRRRGIIPEVTAVFEFMASDAASFITGIDIPVDGGTMAARQPRGTIPR